MMARCYLRDESASQNGVVPSSDSCGLNDYAKNENSSCDDDTVFS